MEQNVEQQINHVLESIDTQLYTLSVAAGILLFFIGLFLIIRKSEKQKPRIKITGSICLGIGILSVLSGFFQIISQ